jgi:hypothetical protein
VNQKDNLTEEHRLSTEDLLNAGPHDDSAEGVHTHRPEQDADTTSQAVPGFDRDGEDPDRADLDDADRDDFAGTGSEDTDRVGTDRADADDDHLAGANPDRVRADGDTQGFGTDSDLDRPVSTETDMDVDDATDGATAGTVTDQEPAVAEEPVATGAKPAPTTADDDASAPLFADTEVDQFRTQWRELQAAFVDSPQQAVQEADELVAQIMQNLAATFAEHKRTLETQWDHGEQGETEDLRQALRRYRSFFNQLLSV